MGAVTMNSLIKKGTLSGKLCLSCGQEMVFDVKNVNESTDDNNTITIKNFPFLSCQNCNDDLISGSELYTILNKAISLYNENGTTEFNFNDLEFPK
jgi:YgiT-type zinc finger domain-containing protein